MNLFAFNFTHPQTDEVQIGKRICVITHGQMLGYILQNISALKSHLQ